MSSTKPPQDDDVTRRRIWNTTHKLINYAGNLVPASRPYLKNMPLSYHTLSLVDIKLWKELDDMRLGNYLRQF